jgi:hypothetical protein
VSRPGNEDKTFYAGPWTWSDSIGSWTWAGHEGAPLTVEVYSDAEEVELALDGDVVGTVAAGAANRYKAEFTVAYRPGQLTATAIRQGVRAETHSLSTAGAATQLETRVENGSSGELVFIEIALTDADGRVNTSADGIIEVSVDGDAVLAAVGSGNPAPTDTYDGPAHQTFDGLALAVVRRTGPGAVTVTISADDGIAPATVVLEADPRPAPTAWS